MSELGRILKEKRESLGLSLSEVSLATKIGARTLAAIEEGHFESLPALPFAKGFVRSYANYLKLDSDKMVSLYLEETNVGEEEPDVVVPVEKSEPAPNVDINDESGGLTKYFIIGGVLLLIVAIVGVKNVIEKYKKEADVSSSQEVSVSPIEKTESEVVESGAVEPTKVEEAKPSLPTEVKEEVSASPPEPPTEEKKEEVVASPPPEPTQAEKKEVPVVSASQQQEAPTPANPEPPQVEKKEEAAAEPSAPSMEVILEALDQVKVSFSNGGASRTISLNAGEVHILRTASKMQLDISDGGAVNLIVDGRNKGVPGSLGERKKIQLP